MLVVRCIPSETGVPVDPCGTFEGQALQPVVQQLGGEALDYSGLGSLFGYSFSFILAAYVIGVVVGSVVRLIRSA